MASTELDSFYQTFTSLLRDGVKANFNVQFENGKAVVSITAETSFHGNRHPNHTQSYANVTRQSGNRSPSYYRRQARRREERFHTSSGNLNTLNVMSYNSNEIAAEEAVTDDKNLVSEETNKCASVLESTEQADNVSVQNIDDAANVGPTEKSADVVDKIAEKATAVKQDETVTDINENGFSCKLCQYWCLYRRDFEAHTATKHGSKESRKEILKNLGVVVT